MKGDSFQHYQMIEFQCVFTQRFPTKIRFPIQFRIKTTAGPEILVTKQHFPLVGSIVFFEEKKKKWQPGIMLQLKKLREEFLGSQRIMRQSYFVKNSPIISLPEWVRITKLMRYVTRVARSTKETRKTREREMAASSLPSIVYYETSQGFGKIEWKESLVQSWIIIYSSSNNTRSGRKNEYHLRCRRLHFNHSKAQYYLLRRQRGFRQWWKLTGKFDY